MIVGEVLLHHVSLVTQADDEIVDAKRRVDLQDVPQNRLSADLYHWLRTRRGLFAQPGTETACQNHSFHANLLISSHKPAIQRRSTSSLLAIQGRDTEVVFF